MINIIETSLLVGLLYSLLTVGLAHSFRIINFPDLTLEGSVILGATLSALSLNSGIDPFLSLGIGFLGGCLAGLMTAFLHVYCNVSKILSGIVTSAILYSLNIRLLGNRSNLSINNVRTVFSILNPQGLDAISILILIILVGTVLTILFLLFRTRYGMFLRILGDNEMFLISLNQNPKSATLVGLGISNGIIGLAGALLVQYKGVCDINMSFGLLVTSLASLMLGEQIRTRRIEFYFFCCVGGSIVYNFIIALVFFGLDTINGNIILSSDVKIITGILFIGLSLLSRFRKTPSFQLFNSNW